MKINWNGFLPEKINSLISFREGEEKLGQAIHYWNNEATSYEDWLSQYTGQFVIIGVKESIGPLANMGKSGAENGFDSFLKSFLNIQNNRYIPTEQIALGGYLSVDPQEKELNQLKEGIAEIDFQLSQRVKPIFSAGKIPLVIGGGHNNAYPIMKAFYDAKQEPISILNIDPHADFRTKEGRHSGNSFSYAMDEGLIKKYLIYGMHESYNSESMLNEMEKQSSVSWISFEKILESDHPHELFLRYIDQLLHEKSGLEIDMDVISGMPASAFTPSGFSIEEVRKILVKAVEHLSVYYLHLPEAAPKTDQEMIITGKALTYLVTDFIKKVR